MSGETECMSDVLMNEKVCAGIITHWSEFFPVMMSLSLVEDVGAPKPEERSLPGSRSR